MLKKLKGPLLTNVHIKYLIQKVTKTGLKSQQRIYNINIAALS